MSSDGNETGVIDDPQGGFQLGGDLTDVASVGLDAFIDILVSFFRVYLLTTTSVLVPILIFFVVSYYAGLWPSSYGSEMMIKRIRRSSVGLFAVSVILPILYLSMWFLTGTESHDGRAADLPSSGVFGTSWEDRLIGPEPASGGLGMLADIFVSIFYTYQVTVTFVLISVVVFATVIFLVMKWPSEVDPLVRRDRIYRVSFGMLVSFSILPVLYAISWIATGWYTPNESLTRVSPQISLPYDSLFGGSQHPFLEQLAAESDPLEVTLQNVVSLHVETLLFVGILAIVFGSILFLILGRSNYLQTKLGQQSLQGGVIIVLVVLLAPAILAGGAWLATGTVEGGGLSEGPPGSTSQCQDFEDGEMGAWSTSSGRAQVQPDGWSLRLDGTLEQSVSAANHADRMVSITPTQESDGEDDFHIQIYDDGELVLDKTTQHQASYTAEVNGDTTIQISSNGGELNQVCTGFQTVALPLIAMEMDTPNEVILRDGVDVQYSVYNVGHVPTGEAFDVGVFANGTGFMGESAGASQTWEQEPLAGGEFSHEEVSFDGLIDARAVGEVEIVMVADPNQEMSKRTTVPGRATRTINVLYANLEGSIAADDVERANQVDIQTEVFNNGTAYSSKTPSDVRILDSDGGVVREWSSAVPELDPEEVRKTNFNHVFRVPGSYTAQIDVRDTLFPEGSVDEVNFDIVAPDLRGELVNVDESSRMGTETEFGVVVENAGNLNMSGNTTADVDVRDSQGQVVDEWVVDVPELDEGETFETTLSATIERGGVHTVSLDVHDEDFPYGSEDTGQVVGIGPNLATNVYGSQMDVGDRTDIMVDVSNIGSDTSLATTADVTLRNDAGDVVTETQLDVPPIEAGERYSEQPFETVIDEAGSYDVDVDVAPTADTKQVTDSDRFEVRYVDLAVDVEATPQSGSNEARIDVTVSNEGTGRSEPVDVDSVVIDEGENVVFSEVIPFGDLYSGRSQTRSRVVELNGDGSYNATVEIDEQDGDSDSVTFSSMSPNLEGDITTTKTEVYGFETDVITNVTNVGSEASDSTTADVTVFDTADGSVVDTSRISVQSLGAGEWQEQRVPVNFPEAGVYEVGIDVNDDLYPGNTVARTKEIKVYQSDLSVRVDANNSDVPPGATGEIEATVHNNGNHQSDPYDLEVEFVSPRGSTIAVEQGTVDSIEAGENATLSFESTLDDIGTNDAIVRVDTAESGTISDSAEIDVSLPLGVEAVESSIPPGELATVEAVVSNPNAVESGTYDATAEFVAPNGSTVSTESKTVGPIGSGTEQRLQFEAALADIGTHDVVVEVGTEGENAPRNRTNVGVSLPLGVEAVESSIPPGELATVEAVVSNPNAVESGTYDATAEFVAPNGSTVSTESKTVGPIGSGTEQRLQFEAALADIGTHDVVVEVGTEGENAPRNRTNVGVSLPLEVGAVESQISPGEVAMVEAVVSNPNAVESGTYDATAEFVAPNGSTVSSESKTVGPIGSGNEERLQFESALSTGGVHDVVVEVDTGGEIKPRKDTHVEVVQSKLRAQVTARDINEGSPANVDIVVDNVGTDASSETNVTAVLRNPDGDVVADEEYTVGVLEEGGSDSQKVFDVELGSAGVYDVEMVGEVAESDDVLRSQSSFEVLYSNLTAGVEADDVTRVNEGEVRVEIVNEGTGRSEQVPAQVVVQAPDGSVIQSTELTVPVLSSGQSHSETLDFTTEEAGAHEVSVDVEDVERPEGSTDETQFHITWPNLHAHIEAESTVVEDNTATFNVGIENVGPGQSQSTTASVDILGSFGNIVETHTVDVPPIASGETHEVSVDQVFVRPGSYFGRVQVQDPEFPEGTTDVTETIEIVHGDLSGEVQFDNSHTVVESDTGFEVTVQNVGNDRAEPTTADVWVTDSNGETVFTDEMDVGSLRQRESQTEQFNVALNKSGHGTAHVDVNYPKFPLGTEDQDRISVISPDLRAELAIDDVQMGDETTIRVDVSNVGDTQANATTGELLIYNQDMDRVVREEFSVESLAPDESTTIEFVQLIAKECWRTEMSCAPGAELGQAGTFSGSVDISTMFAPEGSEDSDTFYVSED